MWPGDYGLLIPDNCLFAIICILKIRRWKLIVRRRPMSSLLISYICGFSVAKSCPTVCNPMDSSMPGSLVLHYLPEFAQIHVHWVGYLSNHLILCCPPSSFTFNLSQHWDHFQWVGFLHQVAKVLELQLQQQFFHEYSGLISFRIDWLDLLAVRETLKSVLQHHGLKASVLWHSAFFMDQLSHLYLTSGEYIALALQNFVDKVMSLLFNTLSRFAIASIPRSKGLLIPWLQSPSAVILEPKERKLVTASTFSHSICPEVMAPDAMIIVFLMLSFKPDFSLCSFTLIKRLFSSSSLSAIRVESTACLRLLIFLPASLFQLLIHPAWHFCIMYSE